MAPIRSFVIIATNFPHAMPSQAGATCAGPRMMCEFVTTRKAAGYHVRYDEQGLIGNAQSKKMPLTTALELRLVTVKRT
jgi:hypothetical protein